MNAKENALRIIRFDRPERIVGGPPCHGLAYLGCNHEGYEGGGHHLPVGSKWTDIWGTVWHREHEGVMGFPRGNPLADLVGGLARFHWPSPDDERICGPLREQARAWNREESFLTGRHRDTLWEKGYMLVGMEELMCSFHTEPGAVRELFRGIMDFQLGMARHYLELGVEMVSMGDDLGTQSGLLLSPEILEEFLVPEYRRLFDLYRSRGVMIGFHSCGHVTPVLEMFMDLGVDVLNPIQATANDLAEVRRITRGRMALQGGVSSGLVMEGPTERIRAEARRCMRLLGSDGGYFCGPDQGMPYPQEHLDALKDEIGRFGRYPLCEAGDRAASVPGHCGKEVSPPRR